MGPTQLGNWALALGSHRILVSSSFSGSSFSGGHRFGKKGADCSVGVPFRVGIDNLRFNEIKMNVRLALMPVFLGAKVLSSALPAP